MKPLSKPARGAGIAASLFAAALLAGCHSKTEPDMENFTSTINSYLAERGHLCMAKYDWPIDVTTADNAMHSRDSVQMPVLEKLGLVKETDTTVERVTGEDGAKTTLQAHRYELTDEGQKYYIHKPVVVATASQSVTHPADFCVATLTLDKVVGWDAPQTQDGTTKTSVLFTYKIDPAPWTQDADFRRAFPMVERVVEGAGTMQLREGVRLTSDGWVAEEFFQR
ncbi:MAG TPA: hypothetical protein VGC09_02360 [Rhodopila sp.]